MEKFRLIPSFGFLLAFGLLATFGVETTIFAQADDVSAGAGIAGCGMFACFMIIPLVIMGVCGYVVYNDATKNNIDNAVLWAVVAAFTTWIGLLIYFLVIKKQAQNK